jgi:hypothetical protein
VMMMKLVLIGCEGRCLNVNHLIKYESVSNYPSHYRSDAAGARERTRGIREAGLRRHLSIDAVTAKSFFSSPSIITRVAADLLVVCFLTLSRCPGTARRPRAST